jgi:hypothetical protein
MPNRESQCHPHLVGTSAVTLNRGVTHTHAHTRNATQFACYSSTVPIGCLTLTGTPVQSLTHHCRHVALAANKYTNGPEAGLSAQRAVPTCSHEAPLATSSFKLVTHPGVSRSEAGMRQLQPTGGRGVWVRWSDAFCGAGGVTCTCVERVPGTVVGVTVFVARKRTAFFA